jgi:streptogramin lyase
MKPLHILPAVLSLAIVSACSTTPTEPAEPSPYPVVNVSPYYEVDAEWPKRPAGVPWADMPGVAIDGDGNVWCYTRIQPAIQVYSPTGELVKSWATEEESTAHQIKIDKAGNIWLADIGLHLVRKFTPDGKELMHIGTPGEKGKDETHLNMPTDMAIASNGDVFISDGYGNARIVHCDKDGKFIKAWGTLGNTDNRFSIPHAIAIDSKDNIYIADRNNVRVQVYNTEGQLTDSWRNIVVPWGFCITANDDIWVCGSSPMKWRFDPKYPGAPLGCPPKDQIFMKFRPDGKLQQMWTIPKATDGKEQPGELNWLHCLALDKDGNIYAGDIIGQRMQKFIRKTK